MTYKNTFWFRLIFQVRLDQGDINLIKNYESLIPMIHGIIQKYGKSVSLQKKIPAGCSSRGSLPTPLCKDQTYLAVQSAL